MNIRIESIAFLLIITAVMAMALRRFNVPYTVGLILTAIVLAVNPTHQQDTILGRFARGIGSCFGAWNSTRIPPTRNNHYGRFWRCRIFSIYSRIDNTPAIAKARRNSMIEERTAYSKVS